MTKSYMLFLLIFKKIYFINNGIFILSYFTIPLYNALFSFLQ
jgi:hypothetical protein